MTKYFMRFYDIYIEPNPTWFLALVVLWIVFTIIMLYCIPNPYNYFTVIGMWLSILTHIVLTVKS
jgi:hypothetical protein